MTGSVRFTEEMTGYAWPGATSYREGWDQGRAQDWTLMFHLTIWIEDLEAFLADPEKEAVADGWVGCPALGGRRPVTRGRFNLFAPTADPQLSNMRYRLWFHDAQGGPYTLEGHKDIQDQPGLDTWRDTTTLFTTLRPGHLEAADEEAVPVFARGILYIRPADFATQLTTFRGDARSVVRFGRLFAATLWRTYRSGKPG